MKPQWQKNQNEKIRPKTLRHGDYQEELTKYGLIYLVSSLLKKSHQFTGKKKNFSFSH